MFLGRVWHVVLVVVVTVFILVACGASLVALGLVKLAPGAATATILDTPAYLAEYGASAATPTPTFTPVPTMVPTTVAFTFTPTSTSTFTPVSTLTTEPTKASTPTVAPTFTPVPAKALVPVKFEIEKIPGAITTTATMKEPPTWIADNGQACKWDIPGGTQPETRTKNYVFTNCMTINLAPKAAFDFDWQYGNWEYWNGTNAMTVTHSVRDFLLWNWASPDGKPKYAGIAWWGPQTGSVATVRYNDGKECTGRSFEIPADPSVHIVGVITNTSERTAAVWSQGPWVLKENVGLGGGGIFEPECQPGIYGNQIPAASTSSAGKTVVAPPVAPAAETAMQKTAKAVYGPITFTAVKDPMEVQHLGAWSFHLKGWDVETKADGFVCTWYDWATQKAITTEWSGDYKLVCIWSPPANK